MTSNLEDLDGAQTMAETAALLRYHPKHVQRLVASGAIAHIRVGQRVLIPKRAITDYLDNSNEKRAGDK